MSRPATAAPANWTAKAAKERDAVVAEFRRQRADHLKRQKASKTKKPLAFTFEFAAYRDEELKQALNLAYHRKCAYCESVVEGTGPIAVEHYRPKGEVIEGGTRIKPAYYWLAADWENLLPSCTDCNSPRGHVQGPDGKKVTRGKGNHFPLERGSKRAKSPGGEKQERPLLLHPERDDPAQHLEFVTDDTGAGVIRAVSAGGVESPRGIASIEVYALDRPVLQLERQKCARKLASHLRNTRDMQEAHQRYPQDPVFKQRYQENIEDLRNCYLAADAPFAAMCRALTAAWLPGVQL